MSLSVEMTMFKSFISILVLHVASMVYAQDDQSGFISLDCGAPPGSYTDNSTGINYVSDDGFIEDYWATVNITDSMKAQDHEIIHLSLSDYINVCHINTGHGIPIISALEIRLLDITMYESQFESLILSHRNTFASNETVRYADDMYDRIWYPLGSTGTITVTNSNLVSAGPSNKEKLPLKVMRTAITPINSTDILTYSWPANTTDEFVIYLHIAEVEILKSLQKREFIIQLNGDLLFGPFSPSTSLTTITGQHIYTGFPNYRLDLIQTTNSTLPPLYNAIEIYTVKQLVQKQTEDQEVAALSNAKSVYGLKRNWQGDPCVPQAYAWDGLHCSYKYTETPRIIFLNLSSSGLSGDIVTALANLTMIESLDLSNNNLTGIVPQFLANLDYLKLLNLTGNNFTRPLPAELLAKSKKRSLFLSIEEICDQDKGYCLNGSCKNKKQTKVVIPVIVAIATVIMVLTVFGIVWMMIKRRKPKDMSIKTGSFKPSNQHYTYFEVRSITNNFKTVIGKGGFGTVFRGSIIGDNQVAVKILSESSSQGYKEFQAEVKLLMDIRHKNITSLVGYCNDSNHKAIIYEYMANGNLEQHLFDENSNVLSWVRRLQIGCDAAEGLVYMHHGCRPPVVHRDVKSSNILLDEGFRAKLADFGLSRACTTEDATYAASTVVAGTCGYLDPEYYTTRRLTEKSDVYSFGVVLLELITSRPAISENINIINWVKSRIEEGSVEDIIDPRLRGIFNIDNAWKVVELAIECVSNTAIKRPAMNDVAMDLKHCLQAEKTPQRTKSSSQSGYVPLNLEFVNDPDPR